MSLSFDEWNVWRRLRFHDTPRDEWQTAPRLAEDTYDLADALVVGSLLITLLHHADRVRMACIAQLVNVIAPIMTEPDGPAWRQTTFHPFADVARHATGTVLRLEPHAPMYDTPTFGEVPLLASSATRNDETGEVTVFAVNRDRTQPMALRLGVRALGRCQVVEHGLLTHEDIHATNTIDDPTRVQPSRGRQPEADDGELQVLLPAQSWNVIRLSPLS